MTDFEKFFATLEVAKHLPGQGLGKSLAKLEPYCYLPYGVALQTRSGFFFMETDGSELRYYTGETLPVDVKVITKEELKAFQ